MKRKSMLLLVVLVVSLALSGCGGGNKEPINAGVNNPPAGNTAKTPGTTTPPSGGGDKTPKGVEVPKEFPTDLIPFLGDAKVDNVIKNSDNKAINVNYTTGSSLKDAWAFYQAVMKDGKGVQEAITDAAHIMFGSLGNYSVTITIMHHDGITMVNIDTRPE